MVMLTACSFTEPRPEHRLADDRSGQPSRVHWRLQLHVYLDAGFTRAELRHVSGIDCRHAALWVDCHRPWLATLPGTSQRRTPRVGAGLDLVLRKDTTAVVRTLSVSSPSGRAAMSAVAHRMSRAAGQ